MKTQNKITDEFEIMLNQLTLEEIIGLKLELASKAIGGKLYGLPVIRSMPKIAQEASLMYAISAASSKMEAARFLGIDKKNFNKLVKKYRIEEYFQEMFDK